MLLVFHESVDFSQSKITHIFLWVKAVTCTVRTFNYYFDQNKSTFPDQKISCLKFFPDLHICQNEICFSAEESIAGFNRDGECCRKCHWAWHTIED